MTRTQEAIIGILAVLVALVYGILAALVSQEALVRVASIPTAAPIPTLLATFAPTSTPTRIRTLTDTPTPPPWSIEACVRYNDQYVGDATVSATDREGRSYLAHAHRCYYFHDLPPGDYLVKAQYRGASQSMDVTLPEGGWIHLDFWVGEPAQTPTDTPTPRPTNTPTSTRSPSPSSTETATPSPSPTSTPIPPTATPIPPTPTSTPRPTVPPTPGREKTITVIIDLEDASVPCETGVIHDSVYGPTNSTAATYFESSRGEIDIFGETVRVEVPFYKNQFPAQCGVDDRMTLANAANEELVKQGYNLDNLWRRFYFLPVCYGGTFIQQLNLFSSECRKPKLLAHELGHTMGRVGNRMHHASTPSDEYGDYSCVMGGMRGGPGVPYSVVPQFNAPHRIALGWADYTDVTESGQYTLIATERADHVILRVPKDNEQAYYLSFRAPIGEDVDLEAEYLNQVSIHTFLSDPTADGDQHSWLLATLGPGESYTDNVAQVRVTCLSTSAESAVIRVELGGSL